MAARAKPKKKKTAAAKRKASPKAKKKAVRSSVNKRVARPAKRVTKAAVKRAVKRSKTTKSRRRDLALDVRRRVLPNGLTLLATRNPAAPTIAISCQLEISRLHEPKEQAGIAALVGDCLDEGTEKYTGEQLAELVEGLGGGLHCASGGVAVQFAAEDVKAAVKILAEVVRNPSFPATGVRRATSLALADLESELDEPRTVAARRFRALCYGSHPYARNPKGDIVTLSKLTPAKLRAFHARWYKPDNARVAAVGDVDPEQMLDLLARAFRSWEGRSVEPQYPDMPAAPSKIVVEHIEYDREQMQVFLGHLGIERNDPDFYKLLVMDHILGSGPGFTSRIARKLRDEQGLCYSVGAGITGSAGKERGLFSAYIGTSPGQEDIAVEGFLREMRRIREELPTEQELSDVKAYLTGSFVWALERNSNLASFLHRCERFDLGDDYVARFPDLINAVTVEDVRQSAKEHLDPDHYYLVTLGKKGGAKRASRTTSAKKKSPKKKPAKKPAKKRSVKKSAKKAKKRPAEKAAKKRVAKSAENKSKSKQR